MGINLVLKTRIKFNGKEYGSADEMPADERHAYERAMASWADPGHANGMIIRTQMSSKITINGQEYDGADHLPPEVRKTYETAMAAMDANRTAAPGVDAANPAAVPSASTLRSPLNRNAPGVVARPGPRPSRVLLILGVLAGLIALLICLVFLRKGG